MDLDTTRPGKLLAPDRKALSEARRQASLARYRNGAPPKGPMSNLRCPEAEADALRSYAKLRRVSPAEVTALAVRQFLERAGDVGTVGAVP